MPPNQAAKIIALLEPTPMLIEVDFSAIADKWFAVVPCFQAPRDGPCRNFGKVARRAEKWSAPRGTDCTLFEITAVAYAAVMTCTRCQGSRWVCEEHPDQPMEHDGCKRAGMPCPDCNASSRGKEPVLPPEFGIDRT
jgi:hypothetical protein